jgi:hypothetical protein
MKLTVGDIISVTQEEGWGPKSDIAEATIVSVSKNHEGDLAYFAEEKEGRKFALTPRHPTDSGTMWVYHDSPPAVVDPRSGHGFVRITRKSKRADKRRS